MSATAKRRKNVLLSNTLIRSLNLTSIGCFRLGLDLSSERRFGLSTFLPHHGNRVRATAGNNSSVWLAIARKT